MCGFNKIRKIEKIYKNREKERKKKITKRIRSRKEINYLCYKQTDVGTCVC